MKLLLVAITVAGFISAPVAGQQPRDPVRSQPVGTAAISGYVLSDERQPRALRRARVSLRGFDIGVARTVISADDGSFTFRNLPSGRYGLSASKDGYLNTNFGARRPHRPGAPIVLQTEERREVSIRLPRGAVITGTLTMEDGQPLPGIQVYALRSAFSPTLGMRQLVPVGDYMQPSLTDDRGVYRIFGLPAGEFAVAAQVHFRSPFSMSSGAVPVSERDVQQALAELRQPRGALSPGPQPSRRTAAEAPSGRPVSLAHVFYPGTTLRARAVFVKLAAGEERTGVDFSMEFVATATISGSVGPANSGTPVLVTLNAESGAQTLGGNRAVRADSAGRFRFVGLAPGSYVLTARAVQTPDRSSDAAVLYGSTSVVLAGEDVETTIALAAPLTVSGRLRFEGLESPPAELEKVRAFLTGTIRIGGAVQLPAPHLEPDGRFTLYGVVPGSYQALTPARGLRAPIGRWWLKSITTRGREVLDAPVEVFENADDVIVTLSAQASEVSGTATVAQGWVVVFSTDRKYWFPHSRRTAAVRPDRESRYSIRNLPPGEYYVIATDDLDDREWLDPECLQRLAPLARRVSVGAEKTMVDFR